ncbi:MAG: hypothetical protein H6Q36_760 [Chloroflexi bacterium]|nr:hypothetical protein [Chloroflexota bacterium]
MRYALVGRAPEGGRAALPDGGSRPVRGGVRERAAPAAAPPVVRASAPAGDRWAVAAAARSAPGWLWASPSVPAARRSRPAPRSVAGLPVARPPGWWRAVCSPVLPSATDAASSMRPGVASPRSSGRWWPGLPAWGPSSRPAADVVRRPIPAATSRRRPRRKPRPARRRSARPRRGNGQLAARAMPPGVRQAPAGRRPPPRRRTGRTRMPQARRGSRPTGSHGGRASGSSDGRPCPPRSPWLPPCRRRPVAGRVRPRT